MLLRIALFVVVFAVGVVLAISGTTDASQDVESIDVGSVTGSHGGEGTSGGAVGGAAAYIHAWYGFHCSGTTCTGDDDPPAKTNTLTITLVRGAGDTAAYTVKARSHIKWHEAELKVNDYDCPQGPPTWVGKGTVKLSNPSVNGTFPLWPDDMGQFTSFEETFRHTTHPTTEWTKKWDQNPLPWNTAHTYTYSNVSNNWTPGWAWTYDPENPSTNSFVVQAQVTTDFDDGHAIEITVTKCKMKVRCELEAEY